VEAITGKRHGVMITNPAGARLTAASVGAVLEAEAADGGPTDKEGMTAAVSELADRT
jgi:hypothetical protein